MLVPIRYATVPIRLSIQRTAVSLLIPLRGVVGSDHVTPGEYVYASRLHWECAVEALSNRRVLIVDQLTGCECLRCVRMVQACAGRVALCRLDTVEARLIL
jgi:hypothetical protein